MNSAHRNGLSFFLCSCLVLGSCPTELNAQESAFPQTRAVAPSLPATPPTVKSIPVAQIAPAAGPQLAPKLNPGLRPPAPAATAPLPPPPEPVPQTVEQLIARAEAEYARGQANYTAGHLEAARDDFDAAFNVLLQGPISPQSDERLQAEFDKIVEATHELELQALKIGDGFTEQRAEPAPIDEANSVTFPVDPNIKAKAQAELANTHSDLPLMLTDPVVSYINYFSSRGHGTIERALIRSGRYKSMISRVFREEGVPQDLMFLAQAESGFQPLALSRMGARGMWQFMPWDGVHAGLQHTWWVDERQDPEKATRAAARLLKELYNQFGDWYLAMAAYNSGPGTVQRAVQRTGYADFWELYSRNVLPQETRNYVPIILAMTIMAKNPTQYGLDQLTPDSPMTADTVRIHYPIDLRLVAECTDSSTQVLQELNPSLLRMTTPKDMDFELHLPEGMAQKFQTAVAAIPEEMRVYWRYHRVEAGESLSEIAHRYHTTPDAIAEANNLGDGELIKDTKLIIPVSPARSAALEPGRTSTSRSARRSTHYKVRKGDTLSSVADDFGISAEQLRQWNHIKGNSLPAGRSLVVAASNSHASERNESGSYDRHRNTSHQQPRRQARDAQPARSSPRGSHAKEEAAGTTAKKSHSASAPKRDKPSNASKSTSKKHRQQG